eukprot:SAG31_NODE_55_length_29938_cov_9.154027_23_plen_173_part_00
MDATGRAVVADERGRGGRGWRRGRAERLAGRRAVPEVQRVPDREPRSLPCAVRRDHAADTGGGAALSREYVACAERTATAAELHLDRVSRPPAAAACQWDVRDSLAKAVETRRKQATQSIGTGRTPSFGSRSSGSSLGRKVRLAYPSPRRLESGDTKFQRIWCPSGRGHQIL